MRDAQNDFRKALLSLPPVPFIFFSCLARRKTSDSGRHKRKMAALMRAWGRSQYLLKISLTKARTHRAVMPAPTQNMISQVSTAGTA